MGDIIVRIKPKYIERVIFACIIIILIGVIVYMTTMRPTTIEQPIVKEPVVKDTPKEIQGETPNEVTNEVPEEVTNEVPEEVTNEVPEEEPEQTLSHENILLKFEGHKFDKRGEDWGSMVEVHIVVENGLDDAIEDGQLELYFYDEADVPQVKTSPREVIEIGEIKSQGTYDENIETHMTVNDLDKEKVLKIRLFDGSSLLVSEIFRLDVGAE